MDCLPDSFEVLGVTGHGISEPDRAGSEELRAILSDFEMSDARFQRSYARDVQASMESLRHEVPTMVPARRPPYTINQLLSHRDQCRKVLLVIFTALVRSLSPSTPSEAVRGTAGHWARVTHRSLLKELASNSESRVEGDWKQILLSFAQALAIFQRSRRLVRYVLRQSFHECFLELENTQCDYSDLIRNTDWILIQASRRLYQRFCFYSCCFLTIGRERLSCPTCPG
jgi:hypothetical protein